MNLKKEFNSKVMSYCNKTGKSTAQVSEPQLVKILVDVLNIQPNIYSRMYHQKYVDFRFTTGIMRRELCDTLLIIKHSSYFRVSFVQNKKKLYNYGGLGQFNINCGQHYLLQNKPLFTPTAGSGIMPAVSNFLNGSVYDTVTTYSVFYYENNGEIDLDLASSCSVICSRRVASCSGCGARTSKACHSYSKINYNKKNTHIDYDSHLTLDEIEINNEFGEVIEFQDFNAKLGPLISFFDKDDVYDFFGISKEIYNNDYRQTDRIGDWNNNIYYYYIPKMVLVNIENYYKG